MADYEPNENRENNGNEERIIEWEMGLPKGEDLTPLSQSLIPPELASAFSISPVPYHTLLEVTRASQSTLSSIRGSQSNALSSTDNNNIKSFTETDDAMVLETEEADRNGSGSESRKSRKPDCTEEVDSALRRENSNEDLSARTVKRPRLVWTPQLHKRFVDVVAHLGLKNAVPKTIMQLMNVEGLTRENVASHLQKYRLYLKRMQGLSNDDPSSSDHQLSTSTPVPPQCLQYENGAGNCGGHVGNDNDNNNGNNNNGNCNNGQMRVQMYGEPAAMMSVPMDGMMNQGFHHGHAFGPTMYNMNMNMCMNMNMGMNFMTHQRDWSVNKHGHGSVVSFPHHIND